MCGRYTLTNPGDAVRDLFDTDVGALEASSPAFQPRYNVAPTQEMPVYRLARDRESGELAVMRWGLVPHWAKSVRIGARFVNARSESAATTPAFRDAFSARRCLVPADGFYEWRSYGGRRKQPFYIHLTDRRPFAFAGLWARWRGDGTEPIDSFTILTTEPNAVVRPLHDRMPVILPPSQYEAWLHSDRPDSDRAQELLLPFPAGQMQVYAVGTRVNRHQNDDPRCLERAASQGEFVLD